MFACRCILVFCLLLILNVGGARGEGAKGQRILLIGNSYTSQVREMLVDLVSRSSQADAELVFITKGGMTLAGHLKNAETVKQVMEGGWDRVVLQEQSLTPAYREDEFLESAKHFCKMIHAAGAMPSFYMTWERRDTSEYSGMGEKLSAAYRKAARLNQADVVKVGDVWSAFRREQAAFKDVLYKKDGSHPSVAGAYLVSCVFIKSLGGDVLTKTKSGEILTDEVARLIRRQVNGADE